MIVSTGGNMVRRISSILNIQGTYVSSFDGEFHNAPPTLAKSISIFAETNLIAGRERYHDHIHRPARFLLRHDTFYKTTNTSYIRCQLLVMDHILV